MDNDSTTDNIRPHINLACQQASEAILNDQHIQALLKALSDLTLREFPNFVLKNNGDLERVYSDDYNRISALIHKQIEHRQSQILSFYNLR